MTHKNTATYVARWREKSPENREKYLAWNRQWKRKNDCWKKVSKEFLSILI